MNDEGKRRRPGGRTEKIRQAVAAAVLKLIQSGDLEFEVQQVAALSGVHRATIFRRWPDREALIGEALTVHISRLPVERTGHWQEDVRHMAYGMRDFFADPVELAMNRTLAFSGNDQFLQQASGYYLSIMKDYERLLCEAKSSGMIHENVDTEMIIMILVSTLLTLTLFTKSPVGDEVVDRLVNQVIAICLQSAPVAVGKTWPKAARSGKRALGRKTSRGTK
jgi:AcrR family transcriptional regulator